MSRIPVAVYAEDPILRGGTVHLLRPRPEVEVLATEDNGKAVVSLVVVDALDDETARLLRRLRRTGSSRTGLVVGRFDQNSLRTTIECDVAAVVRRAEAGQDRLVGAVTAIANGEAVLPGDLLDKLLAHVGRLQRGVLDPNAPTLSTLSTRETDILRLVAEGLDTAEIALKMSYSERTVKNVLHEVSTRLNLRNRAHAVGYVMRHGLI
ncbi:response regulator transcription factor [Actinokineospora inagensis]|uniref:response regulator transcription factor n=1 Tax=Actinokineospora inagensis TaxID=103730 RepID=UPI000422F594|nr:response regulator transcription factor [Actinokineospora inagensis]